MAEPNKHARLGASGADGWMVCPGWENAGVSNTHNRGGTAKHDLGYLCLSQGTDTDAYLGRIFDVEGEEFEVDDAFAENVQTYVDTVREYVASTGGELLVEQRVPVGHLTGEGRWVNKTTGQDTDETDPDAVWKDAEGTADAIILTDDEIIVGDYKSGYKRVEAERNRQMRIYALGALKKFGVLGDFKRVRMFISQPAAGKAPSEWACTVEELLAFGNEVGEAALKATASDLAGKSSERNPSEDACRYCKGKAELTCNAVVEQAIQFVSDVSLTADAFADLTLDDQQATIKGRIERAHFGGPDMIDTLFPHIGLIEDVIKAVAARAEALLEQGEQLKTAKLVMGDQGNRAWADKEQAEQKLKSMRLKQDEMYTSKVIGPAGAEKLKKAGKLGDRQWTALQSLIVRPPAKRKLVPITDKRPAVEVKPVESQFEDLDTVHAETCDLI